MWNPKIIDTDKTLYVAIADAIERDIKLGILKQNEKMPPQRLLAKLIGVNLTTISRAYKDAERRGLISGTIGSGTYVLQKDKKTMNFPEVVEREDDIIDLGLVGSAMVEEYNLSKLLKEIADDDIWESLLNYAPSQGIKRHRAVAVEWMKQYGVEVDAEHVVICTGATHAVNCCLLGLFQPEDRIAVDSLTFTGLKNAAQMHQLRLEPVAMDEEGMIPESLEDLCKKTEIKGIYLMPNMQNPTSTAMSMDRKQAIANIILRYGLILIEDDIYNFTNRSNQKALSMLVPDHGIFICGISKALFPGLRIAFTAVPERFLYKYIQAVTNTVWIAPPISAEIAIRLIQNGTAEKIIDKKNQVIAQRIQLAREILKDFSFSAAENSMFLWLTLPEGWNGTDFENMALMNRVRVVSANKFHIGIKMPPNAVRISLGSVKNNEQLKKGLNSLVRILKQHPNITAPIM